jgi:ABC-type glycerol-3-phosphate transport system permease component
VRRLPIAVGGERALIAIAAVTLFPLLWMVAGSLMAPGEASTYPPPLVLGVIRRSPTIASSSPTQG